MTWAPVASRFLASCAYGVLTTALMSATAHAQDVDWPITEAIRGNVVSVTADGRQGFGFIVAQRSSTFIIVTAYHVVGGWARGEPADSIHVRYYQRSGQYAATSRTTSEQGSSIDIAVLAAEMPDDFAWRRLVLTPGGDIGRGTEVRYVGRGLSWHVPVAAGVVGQSGADAIDIERLGARTGTSGAPLFSAKGIAGLMTQATVDRNRALPIALVRRTVAEAWSQPWDLGESIVGCEKDESVCDRATPFDAIAAGGRWTCGLTDGEAFCWGGDDLEGTRVPIEQFDDLSVGDGYACGRTPADDVYCWGNNSHGQLGDGSSDSRNEPRVVRLQQGLADLTTGVSHTCGLTSQGAAFCWGSNSRGQIGDGSNNNTRRDPRLVRGNYRLQSIAAGASHTCAATSDNKAYCWGDGFSGQIGSGRRHFADEPFEVLGDLSIRLVVAGELHTCGLTTQGRVYCWGDGQHGQLGNGTRDERLQPDSVYADVVFRDLTSGDNHTCGLASSKQVYCWGRNATGQLGDGTRQRRETPVLSAQGQTFGTIEAGAAHTCGITTEQRTLCWGSNARGQLGTGATSTYSLTPLVVTARPQNGVR